MSDAPAAPLAAVTTAGLFLPNGDASPSPVVISVELLRRLPMCAIVGPSAQVARAQAERIRSAIEAVGFEFPRTRIVVSYDLRSAPEFRGSQADFSACDLPIALAILEASGQIKPIQSGAPFVGRLELNGACSLPGWPAVISCRTAPSLKIVTRP
jgi:predicted ATPase with chaperone activity